MEPAAFAILYLLLAIASIVVWVWQFVAILGIRRASDETARNTHDMLRELRRLREAFEPAAPPSAPTYPPHDPRSGWRRSGSR